MPQISQMDSWRVWINLIPVYIVQEVGPWSIHWESEHRWIADRQLLETVVSRNGHFERRITYSYP